MTYLNFQSAYPLNLLHQRSNLEIRRNFFSVHVAEPWNSLPKTVKEADKIEQFKKLYDDCSSLGWKQWKKVILKYLYLRFWN